MNDNISHRVEIENFFSTLQAKRESFNEFMKLYEPSLAPYFNLFDFIGPDENRLSEIIAFFLDPNAGHGQGGEFLNIFLDKVKLKHLENLIGKVSVTLEKTTETIESSQRRIDIVLDFKEFGLGIENKPWAYDQDGQVADYSKDLENRYRDNYCLIYLSGFGKPPSKESISEENRVLLENSRHLKILPYRDFIDCVNSFKIHCQSERVRYFLQDFENYLKREFGGEQVMYEEKLIIEHVLANEKNLEIALMVAFFQDDIKLKLLEDLKNSLKEKFSNEFEIKWEIDRNLSKEQWFGFRKNTWKNYWILFQFLGSQANDFIYGVSKDVENFPDNPSFNERLREKLGMGKFDSWCPWYQNFEEPYNNWGSSYEPWVAIRSGEMVDKIAEKINKITKELDQIENV